MSKSGYVYTAIISYCLDCIQNNVAPHKDSFIATFDPTWFEFTNHLVGTCEQWFPKVERYINYIQKKGIQITLSNHYNSIELGQDEILVKSHFTYCKNGTMHIVRVKTSSPECSHKGRKADTFADTNKNLK